MTNKFETYQSATSEVISYMSTFTAVRISFNSKVSYEKVNFLNYLKYSDIASKKMGGLKIWCV